MLVNPELQVPCRDRADTFGYNHFSHREKSQNSQQIAHKGNKDLKHGATGAQDKQLRRHTDVVQRRVAKGLQRPGQRLDIELLLRN